ncbi:hypothetical protein AYI69_g3597 [Smittium culicis]|uniref:Uncharacterized protein n=1 Tax=Smittium culicis TaxID=133412 RepID=A0A1R1YJK6_9FUNG|nr:hypothetical protein AYI69_g3597 [Smittium culicis]
MYQNFKQIILGLSEKANALMAQRDHQLIYQEQTMDIQAPGCNIPHIRTRAPIMEVEIYPELLKVKLNMKEDCIRNPLEDEARKDIIYWCPKFFPMNYQPAPLNGAAPPNVNKTDSTLIKHTEITSTTHKTIALLYP